jgi:cytochrome c-type biogenesis protein CcsB
MRKIFSILFSPAMLTFLLISSAMSMGIATFIENDFGSAYARKVVYNAHWFEALLVLLTLNLGGSIFTRKLYHRKKLPIFVFHLAFVFILIGAGITRYFGYEGVMHIREGESSNQLLSENKAFTVNVSKNDKTEDFIIDKGFNNSFTLETESIGTIDFQLQNIYSSAIPILTEDKNGKEAIEIVVIQGQNKTGLLLQKGDRKKIGNWTFSFSCPDKEQDNTIYFDRKNDTFYMESAMPIMTMLMRGQNQSNTIDNKVVVEKQKLYNVGGIRLVVRKMFAKANLSAQPVMNPQMQQGQPAAVFTCNHGNFSDKIIIWEDLGYEKDFSIATLGDIKIAATYGRKSISLPFALHLHNFEIKRYPGSNSPSSYSSYVSIKESGKEPIPFHIYMNNILKHHGYRFFQSSYDNDELGTLLSVNYDVWGTKITYLGYLLLVLGIVATLLMPNTFLRKVSEKTIKTLGMVVLLLLVSPALKAEKMQLKGVDKKHANDFGSLLIQDLKGRTEPIYTYSSDLIRKISRKDKIMGLNPVQLYLDMHMNPEKWMNAPMIKVSNKALKKQLGLISSYATFNQFFPSRHQYILQQAVNSAYAKSPGKRNKYDKDVIKVDERINICYSIFSGKTLKVFPIPNSHEWKNAEDAIKGIKAPEDSMFVAKIMPVYLSELQQAVISGDYAKANEFLKGLHKFQRNYTSYDLPSKQKIQFELLYYKFNAFKKLFPFYATVGLLMLILLIASIIRGKEANRIVLNSFSVLIYLGFAVHTLGFAVRWYIAGHAPMSNGYETMIFISWVAVFAGIVFKNKANFTLPATAILGGFTLMVANLSFMDPEITNLVPVLKSYWLTIHVSVITGSYGFLGLGFIIGLINLILYALANKNNKERIYDSLAQMTAVGHKAITFGLYMVTIGTFLGAVWANESWGRYWGWDPKETWSLITIIVYVLITHARMMPGLKGMFAFTILSVFGFGSVLMTYFGVNYYLSGLHSYAGGDPVPVPTFVYVAISVLFVLSYMAFIKRKVFIKE